MRRLLRAVGIVLAIWGAIAVLVAACGVAVVLAAHFAWWGPLVLMVVPWFAIAVMVALQ